MKKRAKVTVSLETLAGLLHLRTGLAVTHVTTNRNTETVTFYVEGEGLDVTPRRADARNYPLTELMEYDFR